MLYLLQREWLPIYKLDWRTHRRLSFRLDAHHPTGASHHQKIVVVDDAVAFVGGFDLSRSRWDTSAHQCDDPRRRNPDGTAYGPFHDVAAVVDGDCARALGELARERWRRATGREARRLDPAPRFDPWPAHVAADVTDVGVGIARTLPSFGRDRGVDELRALHLDAIAAARFHIFAENQYFTSLSIADALSRRLTEPKGPEIAVISPFTQSGWLEVSTMGVLRARIHRELRARDPHGRYRLYCPSLPWLDHGTGCLNVHSKVLEVDGELLTVGSANLSDRSMRLDTECNLVLEARGDPRLRKAIASLRNRLLGEHLGVAPSSVEAAIARAGGLHAAIDALRRPGERGLVPIEPELDPALDAIVPDHGVLDPETPLDPDLLVADLVPHPEARSGARARMIGLAAAVLALAALALAWRLTPLREVVHLDALVAYGEALQAQPLAPLAVVGAYVVGGLAMVPLTLLIAVTAVVFGPLLGLCYAFAGTLASAACGCAIGRVLGRETVRRLAGQRVNALSQQLGRRGLVAMLLVRLVPVAPFTIVNIVAGATHIRWRDYLVGTFLGVTPGIVIASLFVDRAIAAARDPGAGTFALLAAVAASAVAIVAWLRRRLASSPSVATTRPAHAG
jgi:phosphatidylserine/phosphatidylglycerophosphate/cardiolipin synthase-like enzyme/uncharacterized membrane protein YdjX (TVP38/TMEM64 family)